VNAILYGAFVWGRGVLSGPKTAVSGPGGQCLCPTLNNVALFQLPLATAVTLGAASPRR
jgi:hypothetical protein